MHTVERGTLVRLDNDRHVYSHSLIEPRIDAALNAAARPGQTLALPRRPVYASIADQYGCMLGVTVV